MKAKPEPNAAATRISRSNRCFHRAIRENNAGVDFYYKGSYESSIQALHRALVHLQQFGKHRRRQHHQRKETETANREMSAISGSSFKGNRRGRCNYYHYDKDKDETSDPSSLATMTTRTTRTIRVDLTAIYDCALYLSCHGDSWEAFTNPSLSCSESDLVRIKASILFNMGLVHHTQAGAIHKRSGTEMRVAAALERAILLYGLSLGLQESVLAPISSVYTMALCNNLGQCHASLLHTSESQRWNERLLRLLVWNRHQRTNDDHAHRKNPRTCECFLANTISLILQDPCLSPAA